MIQLLSSKLKKIIYRSPRSDEYLYKIQELEKQIKEIKLQITDAQVLKIEKVIVEKIVCEKIETNYKIDSITTENLSGTMNVGTIYPNYETKYAFNKDEKPLDQSEPGKPKVNLIYE
ncbi:hypothetical protein [Pelotomaculum propionicicum]|uniref:Uncharacterized protein n=1 Tax=Pelotomaculum propionicicum TaxID=258475 RepID=A0A4Y7RWK4_9FIRM|nr:hypothetical protein [Pelotomaculum propionicicum]NLI12889.1 hypothetical protein [Peptococcaceae bacterium]TEB13150.1 hypothetical protein Pmgp_00446 [Pelotomaculum propionicicum]